MSELGDLGREIERRLAAAKAKHVLYQWHLLERMEDVQRRQRQRELLATLARELIQTVVRPRSTHINKTCAVSEARYHGKTYSFCVDECRRSFVEDPRRYVKELE